MDDPRATLILLHGGFWRWPYGSWLTTFLARDASSKGFDTFNLEYRRLGRCGGGGGWPATFDDVAAGVRLIASLRPDRPLFVVGHSAGGHLGLVTAKRLPELIDGVVAMAAPTDLRALADNGSAAVEALVRDAPDDGLWKLVSPIEMVPLGVRSACVHSDSDQTVRRGMSIRFVDAACDAGDDSRLELVSGERHRDALLPWSKTWNTAMAVLAEWSDTDGKNASRTSRDMSKQRT